MAQFSVDTGSAHHVVLCTYLLGGGIFRNHYWAPFASELFRVRKEGRENRRDVERGGKEGRGEKNVEVEGGRDRRERGETQSPSATVSMFPW